MTKSAVTDWSTTASSNTDVGGIGIEGSNTISNLDNAMREIMSQLADVNAGTSPLADTFCVADPADLTKKVRIDAGGVTAGQTRVLTMLDANLTLGTMAGQSAGAVAITGGAFNGTVGATTPGTGAFTTLIAQGTTLTGNMLISKASPTITFTSTGTGSDSSISENGAGLTYAADSGNEVASSFHIWTVDGTQSAALNASALTLGTNVALAFAGTGAATTRTNLGLVIGTNVQAYDADLDAWAGKTAPTGTVVGTSDTQTLTAKTLTSPIIGTSPTAAGATWTNLGSVTTVDINGGTVDGVAIGASSASTGAFTTLTTSSTIVASGTVTGTRHISTGTGNAANPAYVLTTAGALAGLYTSAADTINFAINSASVGTVTSTGLNAMAIGATSASTGAFTTLTTTSTIVASGTTTATRFITTGVGNATNPAVAVATAGALAGLYSSASNTLNFAINTASVGTVTSTGLNAMAIGASTASTGAFTTLAASTSINLPVYTVAGLPAAGTMGRKAYASNLRVFNGAGTQEGAGLGTGGEVTDNGTAWKITGTNVTAVA